LDVEPLGQQPITSIPSAGTLGSINACAKPNVTNGKTANCDNIPMSIPNGRLMCFSRGSVSVALPIPNMIIISETLMTMSKTVFRADGVNVIRISVSFLIIVTFSGVCRFVVVSIVQIPLMQKKNPRVFSSIKGSKHHQQENMYHVIKNLPL
jgi:hypothetical protein